MKLNVFHLFAIIFILNTSLAYSINLSCIILDEETNERIPFANIWIPESTIGTTSDENGYFSFSTDTITTINISSIGYITQSVRIDPQNVKNPLEIYLKRDITALDEITVKPDFSYDEMMFKKVLTHKKDNMNNLSSVKKFSNYDRTSVLLVADKENKLQKRLKIPEDALVKDKTETSYLPIYYKEVLKDVANNDVVTTHKDGILPNLNEQIENLVLNKIAIDFNFYKNQITVLDRGFISPLSKASLLYYNIYLSDSTISNGTKKYKFSFYPKNKHGLVFKGHFWVEDNSFALTYMEATLSDKANINFIESLKVEINYEKQPSGKWFYKNQKMDVVFSFGKNTELAVEDSQSGDIKESGKFHINRNLQYSVSSDSIPQAESKDADVGFVGSYDDLEQQTKAGIEKLKQNKIIRGADKVGDMFLSGYYTQGIIEVGPIFDIYTSNELEGNRFTLPFRTGAALFKNYTIGGYLGYGTKSKEIKYGLSTAYLLPFDTRTIISASYSDDYVLASKNQYTQFIQENPYNRGNGNFISALTSKKRNSFVYRENRAEVKLETDLSTNIGLSINPYYNRNYSTHFIKFKTNDLNIDRFDNSGILINLRFAFDQDYDEVYFARIYYGNTLPVINTSFDVGQITNVGESTQTSKFYALSNLSVKHRFNLGQAYIRYMVNIGYMFGHVPFTLLDKPYGTNSLGYSRYSFNLLDYSSFAHNLYSNVHLNLNGGGVIFNHIPLISALNLREMVSLKCHYGTQTKALKSVFEIPEPFNNRQTSPYMEIGVGITNIFKVLRVEYVRSLNTGDIQRYSEKHGIRMRFEVMF